MRKKQIARSGAAAALLLLGAVLAAGCAGGRGRPERGIWREAGLASWYGRDFNGRRAANGERYNMYAMTAAHKTLPLGTEVTVTHRETGRRVRVRITDRGPFVAGRIIDLSYGAARRLGTADAGVAPVILEAELPASAFAAPPPVAAVRPSAPAPPAPSTPAVAAPAVPEPPALRGVFTVQVGAFATEENAQRLREVLQASSDDVHVVRFDDNRGTWWRVRAGRWETEDAARISAASLVDRGYAGFVVRED